MIVVRIDSRCAPTIAYTTVPAVIAPRLEFKSAMLWQIVLKIKSLIDGRVRVPRYADALGVLLLHDLWQFLRDSAEPCPPGTRGSPCAQPRQVALA